MGKFIVLVSCLTILQTTYALKCLSCDSRLVKDCNDITAHEKNSTVCGEPFLKTLYPACLKQVLKDKYSGAEIIIRKCIIIDDRDPTKECEPTNPTHESKFCETCLSDNCNGSSSIDFGLTTFFSTVFVLISFYFYH